MSIYQRGDVWYYLFYINGRRHRGSTKTKNQKQAERVEAKKWVAAEEGQSLRPKRVPLVREFAKQFIEWLDKTTLAQNTKADYKNGRRLILKTPPCGMRMDQTRRSLQSLRRRLALFRLGLFSHHKFPEWFDT